MSTDLMPEELLLVQLVRVAIRDAQGKDARLSEEARLWLWWFAPTIAERANVTATSLRCEAVDIR